MNNDGSYLIINGKLVTGADNIKRVKQRRGRGRPKGKKDRLGLKRNKLMYSKAHNPARARCHRTKGSPNKFDWSSFVQWCEKFGIKPSADDKAIRLKYYEWKLACINGKRGRQYRSRERMFINPFLEECLLGMPFDCTHTCYDWDGKEHIHGFMSKEDGFRHIRELKLIRARKVLSILRKIRRLKVAIAQEQTSQGSLGHLTNN
jgi:hypothetical protein